MNFRPVFLATVLDSFLMHEVLVYHCFRSQFLLRPDSFQRFCGDGLEVVGGVLHGHAFFEAIFVFMPSFGHLGKQQDKGKAG